MFVPSGGSGAEWQRILWSRGSGRIKLSENGTDLTKML